MAWWEGPPWALHQSWACRLMAEAVGNLTGLASLGLQSLVGHSPPNKIRLRASLVVLRPDQTMVWLPELLSDASSSIRWLPERTEGRS